MLPRIAEVNGGIDICGEPMKTRLKTLFSFVLKFANVDQNFCNWAKSMPVLAGRLVWSFFANWWHSCFFGVILFAHFSLSFHQHFLKFEKSIT